MKGSITNPKNLKNLILSYAADMANIAHLQASHIIRLDLEKSSGLSHSHTLDMQRASSTFYQTGPIQVASVKNHENSRSNITPVLEGLAFNWVDEILLET